MSTTRKYRGPLQRGERKKIYINQKQYSFLKARQKTRTWVGGRGSGKTRVIGHLLKMMTCGAMGIDPMVYRIKDKHFGAKIFLLGATYEQILTKFWPEIQEVLEQHGLKEHVGDSDPGHFVVCKKPPEWYGRPQKKPRKYENIITFWNGFTIELLSFDRQDNRRGGSYDAGIIDEAALIDETKYNQSIGSLVRGNVRDWSHPLRFSKFLFTSRAWKQKGKWVETKMKRLAAEHPDDYLYIESSAEDNRAVLGDQYFIDKQREFSPLIYAIEILNKAVEKIPDGFYEFLDEEIHCYSPKYDMDYQDEKWKIEGEKDLNPGLELDISFDFNAAFTSATVWQEHLPGKNDGRSGLDSSIWELRMLRNFYVKYTLVDKLVENICDHYLKHATKVANIYGGADGHTKWAAMSQYTYYEIIKKKLEARGWTVFVKADVNYSDIEHKIKHLTLNACLRENDPTLPVIRVNEEHGKEYFISMSQAPITGDFKKDKKSEKQKNDDGTFVTPQEYATHLSDAGDNYIFPKAKRVATKTGIGSLLSAFANS